MNISGMNVNPYVVQNGDINYLNGKTKPGTVMITVEGTQRQDGYGIGTTLLSMDLWQLTGG